MLPVRIHHRHLDPVVSSSPSRADQPLAATGGADPATSSPPARIPSSLRPPLARIRRQRRWEGWIQRPLPFPHGSVVSSPPRSRGSMDLVVRGEGWTMRTGLRPSRRCHGSGFC
uniref:Uncharacterized protein n=1 Tax=Oryza rufipogon TaxID=4529 RepID=A0A0E0QMR8_ORYRU